MGSMQAQAYAEMVVEGGCGMSTAVFAHLQSNHFPPVSADFVPSALLAIMAAAQDEWDEEFELPNGKRLSATEIVDGLHLQAFVEAQCYMNYGDEVDEEALDS